MGWNGSGVFTLLYDFTTDRDAGSPTNRISADRMDAMFSDIAAGLEATLNRNGENAAAHDISWGTYKITNLGAATAANDAVRARMVAENTLQYGGTTAGSANAYTANMTYLSALGTGTRILLKASFSNSGATTLNVNTLGAKAVKLADGATALTGGEIVSGSYFEVVYDGTNFCLLSGGQDIVKGTSLVPDTNDGASLGTATVSFSDLFLASGGVINWANGTLTAAHATDPFGAANSLVVTTATSAAGLTVTNTDPGILGPIINLMHNSASPAVSDQVGALTFAGKNSSNAAKYYAYITTVITDPTAASEDGTLRFHTMTAGTNAISLQLTGATLAPGANDGLALGTTALNFSDLFLASGAVINFNNGNVTLTHAANTLAIAPSSGTMTVSISVATGTASVLSLGSGAQTVEFRINDGAGTAICGTTTNYALSLKTNNTARVTLAASGSDLSPSINDGIALGTTALMWSDLFLASGAVVNFNNGNITITHAAGVLTFGGATSSYCGFTQSGDYNTGPHIIASAAALAGAGLYLDSSAITGGKKFVVLATGGTSGAGQGKFAVYNDTDARYELILDAGSALKPGTNDLLALGTATISFSDLFLASGAVVNFNNGNVTLTHSAGLLTLAGALTMSGNATVHGTNLTIDGAGVCSIEIGRTDGTNSSSFIDFHANATAQDYDVRLIASAGGAGAGLGTLQIAAAGGFSPAANDGLGLGTATLSFSDLFLATGAVINFNNSNVTLTHSSGTLTLTGGVGAFHVTVASAVNGAYGNLSLNASSVNDFGVQLYHHDGTSADAGITLGGKAATTANGSIYVTAANGFSPITNDGSALGQALLNWSDLFLANGAVINFNNGNVTITHAAGSLTVAGATTFSLGTSAAFTTGTIELGAASDTTIARSGAGDITIEGNTVYRAGGTDVAVADGGTGASTVANARINLGLQPNLPGGRLTLTTATPVLGGTTASAQGTVYYTPYVHRFVPVYDGTNFMMLDTGGELSQATTDATKSPAACTTNSNYDVFVWSDAGTMRATRGPAWSSDTSRGTGVGTTELQLLNGVYTNKNAITNGPAANRGTYVGTIRTNGTSTVDWVPSASGTTTGTLATLGVWNMYHRRNVSAMSRDTTASHTYNSTTIRARNGNTSNARVAFVSGLAEDGLFALNKMTCGGGSLTGQSAQLGIDIDSTTTFAAGSVGRSLDNSTLTINVTSAIPFNPQLGFHFISANEKVEAAVSATFLDTDGMLTVQWAA